MGSIRFDAMGVDGITGSIGEHFCSAVCGAGNCNAPLFNCANEGG